MMNMWTMSFMFFFIVAIASIYILVESSIGVVWRVPMRQLAGKHSSAFQSYITTLIYCPACTGFWVGMALYGFGWAPWMDLAPNPWTLAGCSGLLSGLLLTTFVHVGHAYTAEVAEQDDESTQARQSE